MTALAVQTIQKTNQTANPPTILQRVAARDQTVIKDCIDNYGNFIWALARKFTNSTEEAEAATQEIFTDIWRYAERARNTQSIEKKLTAMIALRRLIKPSRQAKQISMANIDVNERTRGRSGQNFKIRLEILSIIYIFRLFF